MSMAEYPKDQEQELREQGVQDPTKRKFLTLLGSGITAGAILVACGGGGEEPGPDNSVKSPTEVPSSEPTTLPTEPTEEPTMEASPAPELEPEPETLRTYADKIELENGTDLLQRDVTGDIKGEEFNSVMLTTEIAWSTMERQKRGVINRTLIPPALRFAEDHNMKTNGMGVIFSSRYPDWVNLGSFSPTEARDIVKERVTKTIGPLKGKIGWWAVLNEFHPLDWGTNDPLQEVLGDEMLDIAYQAARDADPDAKLIYNGWANHARAGDFWDNAAYSNTKRIVDRLKSKNLIDGVGLQMHLNAITPPSPDDVRETMISYGVPVYITEMDVNMNGITGTDDERNALQADIYRGIIKAALDSGVCKSITFFGSGDKYNPLEQDSTLPKYSINADATLFDDELNPKPAYYAVRDLLKEYAGIATAKTP